MTNLMQQQATDAIGSAYNSNQHHQRHRNHQHSNRREVDVRIPAVEKYAYCLCLHVKPTTIFIAVVKLLHTLMLVSYLLNREFNIPEELESVMQHGHRSTTAALTILMAIIMASVSAASIYAVLSGRAALLMPLYAVTLCDFFFALPPAIYNRDWEPSGVDPDLKGYMHSSHPPNSRYSSFVLSTLWLIYKVYSLCVIWKCYRYLRLRELILPLRITEHLYPHLTQVGPHPIRVIDSTDVSSITNVAPPSYDAIVTSMKTQPPNYEEAMKSSNLSIRECCAVNPPSQPQENQLPVDDMLLQQQMQNPAFNSNDEFPGGNVINNQTETQHQQTAPQATSPQQPSQIPDSRLNENPQQPQQKSQVNNQVVVETINTDQVNIVVPNVVEQIETCSKPK